MAHLFKRVSLLVLLAISLWFLRPPQTVQTEADRNGTSGKKRKEAAEYIIRFSPGSSYQPGTVPFGIGEPLTALYDVIADFEERFPDTRVEVVSAPITVREFLVSQLSNGLAPDIVNVNVEDVWVDTHKGWYVALDEYLEAPNPFVVELGDPSLPGAKQWWDMFRYQAISRGKAAPDGKNYCMSYDMIETAIFYNKDVFAKLGITVPETWEEFLAILKKVQDADYTPLIVNVDLLADWCTDLFLDQLYHDILPGIDLEKDPTREEYLQGYLDVGEITFLYEQGFFTEKDPRYVEIWTHMRELRDYTNRNLICEPDEMLREFVTQRAAMMWNHSMFVYPLTVDESLDFEWGVFYLPSFTSQTSPFASGEPMCVIGGAASQFEVTNSAYSDTGDPATSEKLKRVIALLQFMTLPENNEHVVNELGSLVPNIVGVPTLPHLKPFEEILERRYTTTKFMYTYDLKFGEIQRRMLELYLNDGIDLDGFLKWQDGNLRAASQNFIRRKKPDMKAYQKAWDKLAPQRAHMEGLPHE